MKVQPMEEDVDVIKEYEGINEDPYDLQVT